MTSATVYTYLSEVPQEGIECEGWGAFGDRNGRQYGEVGGNIDNADANTCEYLKAECLPAAPISVKLAEKSGAENHQTPGQPHLWPVLARLLDGEASDDACWTYAER